MTKITTASAPLTFKPKQVVKRLLGALPERARDVLISRYGLGESPKRLTLEAIGKRYGVTRERVRQIENYALMSIRKAPAYQKEKQTFAEMEAVIHGLGGVIAEEELLEHTSSEKGMQNQIHFLLVVGEAFKKQKEDEHFKHRWYIDESLSGKVHDALRKLYNNLNDNDLVSELDIIAQFLTHVEDVSDHLKQESVVKRWLNLSKVIAKNPLGEWGLVTSPNVRAKGMRDYAFLVLRKHGSPIHFREVAKSIEKLFGRKAHVATTHNELIKDARFILVGRGLYALAEWGYMSGVVKDVIRKIIEKSGPLTKEEIVSKVLKERYVKENTILVNLQNPKCFKKDREGRYSVA
ncbi:MAG: sigma factor-like helix-turn-helix DNA-binding protein [bacterium]|nr:sigma factor-like helix-turn-helix DNA-binding protein [bacterium]